MMRKKCMACLQNMLGQHSSVWKLSLHVFEVILAGICCFFPNAWLRLCSLDVPFASASVRSANRPQQSATVRNRSQPFLWGRYGRAYGDCCKSSFKRRETLFRLAGMALRDIPRCFIRCPKSFCVTGPMRPFLEAEYSWVALFVASAKFWRPPSSFRAAGAAL